MMYFLKNLWYNCKRSFGLLKVYYNTIDGDWSSLATVMIYQMDRIAKTIRDDNIIEDAEEVANEIDRTKEALLYLLEDRSYDDAQRDHGKEWVKFVADYELNKLNEFTNGMRNIQRWWD